MEWNKFEKYEHQGTWKETLSILLYVSMAIYKKPKSTVSLIDYQNFELKDSDIKLYNKWVEQGAESSHILRDWLILNEEDVFDFKANFETKHKPKVELWSDRNKTDYYKTKLQAAFEFENYIQKLLKDKHNLDLQPFLTPEGQYKKGENELGIEIKNDTLIKKYGNFYIEYAEKSKGSNSSFVKSGILKNDNSIYFLIGDKSKFWILKKSKLIEIYKEEKQNLKDKKKSKRGIKFKKIATSLGYVYPVKNASKNMISLEEMVREIKMRK